MWDFACFFFFAAIRRDSVSHKRFPFLSHVQFFSCEISLVFSFSPLSEEIQFLTKGFPFLAMSSSSRVRFRLFFLFTAIRRDSVSHKRFPFLSHVQFFSCEISLVFSFSPLSEEIQFLTKGFPFLAMSSSSRVRFRLFVAWNVHTVVFLPIFFLVIVVPLILVLFLVAVIYLPLFFFFFGRCPWCNGCRRKWTRRHEFKSCTRLIAFHIALIPLRKVWIQLFSLQLWVNSRSY